MYYNAIVKALGNGPFYGFVNPTLQLITAHMSNAWAIMKCKDNFVN